AATRPLPSSQSEGYAANGAAGGQQVGIHHEGEGVLADVEGLHHLLASLTDVAGVVRGGDAGQEVLRRPVEECEPREGDGLVADRSLDLHPKALQTSDRALTRP